MIWEEEHLIQLLFFGTSLITLLISYFLAQFLAPKIKVKIIRIIYSNSPTIETQSFLFRLLLQMITPITFILISFGMAFLMPNTLIYFGNTLLKQIPITITVSTALLSVKLGLIWLIYRIASLSSVATFINKLVITVLLTAALFNYLDFDSQIDIFLGSFKASFGSFEVSVYKIFLILMVFLGVFWINKVILEIVKKILNNTNVSPNARALFVKLFSLCFFISVFLIALSSIGFDITSLTIFGSALAVGLGFGFQKIFSNFMSGITISLEEIIKEGDIISIDDKREIKGVVKGLHMRYVLLTEFDGREVMIPNDTIMTSNIANLTHSNSHLRLKIDLLLPYNIDIHLVRYELTKLMNGNLYASKMEESLLHIETVNETGIGIFLLFWIDDPLDLNIARTSLLFEVLDYFKKNNIQIPPPVSKIYLGKY